MSAIDKLTNISDGLLTKSKGRRSNNLGTMANLYSMGANSTEDAVGNAALTTQNAFDTAGKKAAVRAGRMGVNLNSGRFADQTKEAETAEASAVAGAMTKAGQTAEKQKFNNLFQLSGLENSLENSALNTELQGAGIMSNIMGVQSAEKQQANAITADKDRWLANLQAKKASDDAALAAYKDEIRRKHFLSESY